MHNLDLATDLTEERLERAAAMFVEVFGGPPLFEDWQTSSTPSEVKELLAGYSQHGKLVLASDDHGAIIGLGAMEPASMSSQLDRAMPYLEDLEQSMFLAELAVHPTAREAGLGRALCTDLIRRAEGAELFLRVTTLNDGHAHSLYESLGFVDLHGTEHSEDCERTAGWPHPYTSDTRILMIHRPGE